MTLGVVIVILWESIISALGPEFPLPDPALAFAVALGLRRRDDGELAGPLVLGAISGLFTAAPWAVCPLECVVAAAVAAWLVRSIGPAGFLGIALIAICAVAISAMAAMTVLALGPGDFDALGLVATAAFSVPLALACRVLVPVGRRRYGP